MPQSTARSPGPFLLLPENRLARAALLQTALDQPGAAQSVFLYGPSGVGKTHLAAEAIAVRQEKYPGSRAQQWTASQFAAEFAEASSRRTIPLFQAATRQLDFLVLEDIQSLEGRPETQVQLLSLVNELFQAACPIVWTSRKSPGELAAFLPRLISRFRGGVLASLRAPQAESRRRLLEHFARRSRVTVSPAAIRLLADERDVSPRELEASLNGLAALARHDRRRVDSDLVRKFLAADVPPRRLEIEDVCRATARQFGATAADLRSARQHRSAALPRHCAMWLSRELTACKLGQIGRYFGGRDHSTVVHSCQRVARLLEREPDLRAQLDQIRRALGAGVGEPEPGAEEDAE